MNSALQCATLSINHTYRYTLVSTHHTTTDRVGYEVWFNAVLLIYDRSRASSEDAFDTAVRECYKQRARLCIMSSGGLATSDHKHVNCCISVSSLFILLRNVKVTMAPGQ
jgi:hypothetical protein